MAFRLFLTGILIAQVIAAVHVHRSNLELYRKTQDIVAAGYLSVPGALVAETLKTCRPAFYGGLFFTLTVGVGMTLLSIFAVRLWRQDHRHIFFVRAGILAFWIMLTGLMNANGFSAAATADVLLIPLGIYAASCLQTSTKAPPSGRVAAIHLTALAVLTLFGMQRANITLFTELRDKLLLSNSIGIAVNDFYYQNTLYAAQAFKSLNQEQLRTCRLEAGPEENPLAARRLKRRLAGLDWLTVTGKHPPDMVIRSAGASLRLLRHGRHVLDVPADEFMARPKKFLKDFSVRTDRSRGLRRFAFVSLVFVFLSAAYMALFLPLRRLAGRMLKPTAATAAAAVVVVVAGGILLQGSGPESCKAIEHGGGETLKSLLTADDVARRICGLMEVSRRKTDVGRFRDPRDMARSPDLRERYWLAMVLPFSRHPGAFPALRVLVKDPQLNVAYQACRSLGLRRERRGVRILLETIANSGEWYVQLYAYNALKRLGWRQMPSG